MTEHNIDLNSLDWISLPAKLPDKRFEQAARQRQASLTKPPGALGRLEDIAIDLAALQCKLKPQVERVHITVFAADHGVAAEGVSAFPQSVTAEMIRNFANGGAAISVAARSLGAKLAVVNLGTAADPGHLPSVRNRHVGPGTANFTQQPAMTRAQLAAAFSAGRESVEEAAQAAADLYIGGEMGIANTTSATAIASVLLEMAPASLSGPGTGLDAEGVSHKATVVEKALALHRSTITDSTEALICVGGFEIAALAGAYIACAQTGLPVLVDGFISSVAALAAVRLNEGVRPWLFFSHHSAEPGHAAVLNALNAQPLLDLRMRLGEGSGAAVAVPLLRMACALHQQMATFDEAQVSSREALAAEKFSTDIDREQE